MNDLFEIDPYPGQPKILFVGLGISSHTHCWIDLLADSNLNVRLFSVPVGGTPPHNWKIPTYLCDPSSELPRGLDENNRKSFYPVPENTENSINRINVLKSNKSFLFFWFLDKIYNKTCTHFKIPKHNFQYTHYPDRHLLYPANLINSFDQWLAEIISGWRPDVIHTLGLFDWQGGLFYSQVREKYGLAGKGKWVLQLRGGSDIALRRYNPDTFKQIHKAFTDCDEIITDNYSNIEYIRGLGFGNKISPISPVPGSGGLDIASENNYIPPSKRDRIILWPKAYESKWSKAIPVLEAIKLAWETIKPCKIIMTACNPEVREWLFTFPEEIQNSFQVNDRISHAEMISLMQTARVVLAPSLVDGVPNVIYESMAYGAFPIVSPLDTIQRVFQNKTNVLFARNIYPTEIKEALVIAMTDNLLIDTAYHTNLEMVRKIANRKTIAENVIKSYYKMCNPSKIIARDKSTNEGI